MKKIFAMIFMLFMLLMTNVALAQEGLSGTEAPATYGQEKQKILARQEHMRRSQTIQDVARAYREMVSSYKAKRIIRAEEMSQKLDVLLDDPILPVQFANKMRRKQQSFLKRIYGNEYHIEIEVPVDAVSDDEVVEIKQAVKEETGKMIAPVASSKKNIDQGIVEADARKANLSKKELNRQERLAELERRRQERASLKEARRQEKIALKEKAKAEALARKEQKNARRLVKIEAKKARKDLKAKEKNELVKVSKTKEAAMKDVKVVDDHKISLSSKALEAEKAIDREKRQSQKLYAYQQQLLEMERSEIDQYVKLYREDMESKKKALEKEFLEKVDSLYQDGINFFEKKAYRFSRDVLQEVEQLKPDYKLTRQYLVELERHFKFDSENRADYSKENDSGRQQLIVDSLDRYK